MEKLSSQTYIAKLLDASGKMVDFERFSCKRASTVKRQMLTLWSRPLYRVCTEGAVSCAVYATPDGYHQEDAPCLTFDLDTCA